MLMDDPYHCRCFFINNEDIHNFKKILFDFGFKDEFQEDHGQIYGYVLRVEDQLQHHLKVMPNGNIESEMEPPPAYPAAHLNQKHSYPAHKETEQVLRLARLAYRTIIPTPISCSEPDIKKPDRPTHVAGFALMGILGVTAAYIVKKLLEEDDKESA